MFKRFIFKLIWGYGGKNNAILEGTYAWNSRQMSLWLRKAISGILPLCSERQQYQWVWVYSRCSISPWKLGFNDIIGHWLNSVTTAVQRTPQSNGDSSIK